MTRETFRSVVYAVATEGGELRFFSDKGKALTQVVEWRNLGLKVFWWKGKPTWRKIA